MVFKIYIPDTDQWTGYFMDQIKSNKSTRRYKRSVVGGGIDNGEDSEYFFIVGSFKKEKKLEEPAKINLTSPAEATIIMAQSELANIKETAKDEAIISKQAAKRKSSVPAQKFSAKKKRKTNSSKVKRAPKQNDVFSKRKRR